MDTTKVSLHSLATPIIRGWSEHSVVRIAIVHSFYSSSLPSGENAAVLDQIELLTQHGHEVMLFSAQTDELEKTPTYKYRSAVRVATGRGASPAKEIEIFGPDVVHIHNLFPNFGTRWIKNIEAPVVATFHNYRTFCATGIFFREGKQCFECVEQNSLRATVHGCYRDSHLASLPLSFATRSHGPAWDFVHSLDGLICLNENAATRFINNGADDSKVHVIPNPIDIHQAKRPVESNGRWVVVGRMTPEKGILELIEQWPGTENLDVIGVADTARTGISEAKNIRFLGAMPRDQVRKMLSSYQGLLFPSLCLEMQPTVVIEAFSAGIPVVTHNSNEGSSMVIQSKLGSVYTSEQDLLTALAAARSIRESSKSEALRKNIQRYSPDKWLVSIENVYRSFH